MWRMNSLKGSPERKVLGVAADVEHELVEGQLRTETLPQ